MSQEVEQLVTDALIGEQVDAFMRSDVGQFLSAQIEAEIKDSLTQLKNVSAHEPAAVILAQTRVRIAELMKGWIERAIADGLRATNILEQREDEQSL
jgi:hypothetical protein